MDPFSIASAAAAAAQLGGQWMANSSNADMSRDANRFSAKQAALNRAFQERMSNTAWQRGVIDMKKAGINPMLAVSQGGASAPSGSSASGTTGAPQQSVTKDAASTAIQASLAKAQIDNLDANTAKTVASTAEPAVKAKIWNSVGHAIDKVATSAKSIWNSLPSLEESRKAHNRPWNR